MVAVSRRLPKRGVPDVVSGLGPLPRRPRPRSSTDGSDTSVRAARGPVGDGGDGAVCFGVGCPVRWRAAVVVVGAVSGLLCHGRLGTRAGGFAGVAGQVP